MSESAEPAPQKTAAVGAARGLVFITFAKLWFMAMGYVVQFALPRALGSPEKFGIWINVLNWVSPLNNVMVTATIQGVSKFTSTEESRLGSVVRAALKLQLLVGGSLALAFFAGAPLMASFEHDPALATPLRLASGIVAAYAFYSVFVGAANGQRAFHKQAALDVSASTMRAGFVVGAAWLTHSALAAVGGFVASSSAILVAAALVIGLGRAGEPFPVSRLARFFFGVAFYLLIVNLLMFVDGILLKRLVAEAAMRLGDANPSAIANTQEGFYGAVQAIARLPYQLILAVTFVIFPLVSKATFESDGDKTRGYVASTMRYSLVVVALMGSAVAARPEHVMRLFYKPEYAVGAHALAVLSCGYVCFSLFNIAGTIINGSGRTLPTTIIGSLTLLAATAANWFAIGWALEHGRDPLLWAAIATASAMAFGLVASWFYLQRMFGASIPLLTLVRTALASAAALGVGRVWPSAGFLGGKPGTLIACSASAIAFIVVAIATGELSPSQLRALRRRT